MFQSPTPGISYWLVNEDDISELHASITGPPGTPFEGGIFKLKLSLPERYPFEPPQGKHFAQGSIKVKRDIKLCTTWLNRPTEI